MPLINCCPEGEVEVASQLGVSVQVLPRPQCDKYNFSCNLQYADGAFSGEQAGMEFRFTCEPGAIGHLRAIIRSCSVDETITNVIACDQHAVQGAFFSSPWPDACCDLQPGPEPVLAQIIISIAIKRRSLPIPAAPCCGNQCVSRGPIRYATGELVYVAKDITTAGFGLPWDHTRSFSNRRTYSETMGQGFNWLVQEWQYVTDLPSGDLAVQGRPNETYWFRKSGNDYLPDFGIKATLVKDTLTSVYRMTEIDTGLITEFDVATGMFRRRTDKAGNTIEVTATADNVYNVTQVERTYSNAGDTVTEQLLYAFTADTGDTLLGKVTLRRKTNNGPWENVQEAAYTYYQEDGPDAFEGDLKTASTQTWDGNGWAATGTSHYRYWTTPSTSSSSSSSSSSGSGGIVTSPPPHLLKYVVEPAAFARMVAAGLDPLTASNSQVSQYADYYFEYDSLNRVVTDTISGGSQTYEFSYAESSFPDGVNSWKTKTVETRPDGSQNVVYSNYAGLPMLSVLKSGSDEWCRFTKYNSEFRPILMAEPSAITGYDETKADLLNAIDGNYQYLRDFEGLIQTFEYHVPTGWPTVEALRHGELGDWIKLRDHVYTSCCSGAGSSSSSSSSSSGASGDCNWFPAQLLAYPDDGSVCGSSSSSSSGGGQYVNGNTRQILTSYSNTYWPGTCAIQQRTTTWPVIPTEQNGSGVADSRKDYFDLYGNLTWQMDERGFLTRRSYDIPTGAVIQTTSIRHRWTMRLPAGKPPPEVACT